MTTPPEPTAEEQAAILADLLSWDEKGNFTLRPATPEDADLPQGDADYSDKGGPVFYLPPEVPIDEGRPRD